MEALPHELIDRIRELQSSAEFAQMLKIPDTAADAEYFPSVRKDCATYLGPLDFDNHHATCTLTFETPKRPEGPAWLSLRQRTRSYRRRRWRSG